MSVFSWWKEGGIPEEHFLEIVQLKHADSESIFMALVNYMETKQLQVRKIIGSGFNGASTFSRKRTRVQTRIKKLVPHALYVYCHCHLLQSACVQAANSTNGIKHVNVTLTKFFNYSPKRAESLKMIKQELKVAEPSNIRWLAHEKCVKAVTAS